MFPNAFKFLAYFADRTSSSSADCANSWKVQGNGRVRWSDEILRCNNIIRELCLDVGHSLRLLIWNMKSVIFLYA